MFNSPENFQYDSCVSRGICSISPRTFALQVVLLMYLKLLAKYSLKLLDKNLLNKDTKDFILNAITITVSHPEFTETSFSPTVKKFKEKLPIIIEKYNSTFNKEDFKNNDLKTLELFKESDDVINAIKFGERELKKNLAKIPTKIRDLYNIMLVIAKSISINLLDLESFEKDCQEGFLAILNILEKINTEEQDSEILKEQIQNAAKADNKIMNLLHSAQEERFGTQTVAEVSYTTTPGKAALVVGSNIKELENILESFKDTEIDVYTHDDMMLAHTFPKFKEYKHLKGQFGQGLENCLLDFATFPGPIILTKHSLHNIENLYRGRLFTTDYTCPKGVLRIENNDFSDVIKSCNNSRGFKNGKQCESINIGFDFEKTVKIIKNKLTNEDFENIFLIGLEKFSLEQKAYFEKLIKTAPDNTLIISFSYNSGKNNIIPINTCFDNFSIIRIFEQVKDLNIPITVFIPKCDRNSISQMVYLSEQSNTKVYVGKCAPIILNPTLISTLKETFSINSLSSAKKDLDEIINNK